VLIAAAVAVCALSCAPELQRARRAAAGLSAKVELLDCKGRLVLRFSQVHADRGVAQIDAPRNLKGMYVLRVTIGNQQIAKSFVLK